MYFLKKNIPLLTIIILTVIVALTMAVLDIQLYVEYLDAKEKTDENVNRIQNCVKKKPGPHPENVKRKTKILSFFHEKIKYVYARIY